MPHPQDHDCIRKNLGAGNALGKITPWVTLISDSAEPDTSLDWNLQEVMKTNILFRENKEIFPYFSRWGECHKKRSPFWKLRNGASSPTLLRVLSSPQSQHVLSQDLSILGTWMPTDKKRSPNFLQKCLRSKDDDKWARQRYHLLQG